MRIKRVLVALTVMTFVVLAGIYWENQRTFSPANKNAQTDDEALQTPDLSDSNWTIQSGATETVSDTETITKNKGSGADRFVIPGTVVFPEGTPPERIRVKIDFIPVELPETSRNENGPRVQNLQSNQDTTISRTLTTDEKGRFGIKNSPPGLYRATSVDTDWVGKTSRPIIETKNSVKKLDFSVKRTGTLIGNVVNQDSDPISNATIPYTGNAPGASTDDRGRFVLKRLPANEPLNYVKIHKDGYQPYHLSAAPLDPGEIRRDTFVLHRGASLTVRVRTPSGDKITDGRVILRPMDDPAAGQSGSDNGDRIKTINDKGEVTFSNIRPGRVKIMLTFASHIAKPRTLSISAGQSPVKTLEAIEGKTVRIQFINAQTDEVVQGVRPRVTAYDDNNRALTPAFKFRGFKPGGVLAGVLHPRAKTIKVRSESSRFRPRTSTFSSGDLPDIEMKLTPIRPEDEQQSSPGLLTIALNRAGMFSWSEVTQARVYVIDRTTGRRIHSRTGRRSAFRDPFSLRTGTYTLYGAIKTKNENYVVVRNLDVQTQQPGVITVTPDRAARITGKISRQKGPTPASPRVVVSLVPSSSPGNTPGRSVYVPDPLSAQPEQSGEFSVNAVPPNFDIELQVRSRGNDTLRLTSEKILRSKSLTDLTPGETRDLGSLELTP